jgi:hypothetical protein
VTCYAVALVFCALCARRAPARSAERRVWLATGMGMAMLGVNKQLDLQTLFTHVARKIAMAEGWYDDRQTRSVLFIAVAGVLGFDRVDRASARITILRNGTSRRRSRPCPHIRIRRDAFDIVAPSRSSPTAGSLRTTTEFSPRTDWNHRGGTRRRHPNFSRFCVRGITPSVRYHLWVSGLYAAKRGNRALRI